MPCGGEGVLEESDRRRGGGGPEAGRYYQTLGPIKSRLTAGRERCRGGRW